MIPNLVELTLLDGRKLHVNLELVTYTQRGGQNIENTELCFIVKESKEEVIKKAKKTIDEAWLKKAQEARDGR